MSGVKGRSGRKSKFDELQTYEVAEMSVKVVRDYLNSTAPLDKKVEVAKHFVLKAMPTKVEGEGLAGLQKVINIIYDPKDKNGSVEHTPKEVSSRVSPV